MGKAVKQTGAGSTTAPRQSLAATHPSNYVKSASTKMPPPPAPTLARQTPGSETAKTKSSSATSITHPYPTPTPSPPEKLLDNFATPTTGKRVSTALRACPAPAGRPLLAQIHPAQTGGGEQRGIGRPWEQHNDPTFTVSDSPPFWTRNHTVLKADTNVENGYLTSPTYMHGLPFGSMTEAAHHYPSEDSLHLLK